MRSEPPLINTLNVTSAMNHHVESRKFFIHQKKKRREITIVKVYSSDSKSLTMDNLAQFSSTSLFSGSCQFRRVGTPFNFNLGFVLKVDACKQESKVNNDSNIDHTVYNKKVKTTVKEK